MESLNKEIKRQTRLGQ
ncbi:hypothetical protein [uncultured Streptococcus sp.]|nr:hypothetical protein [uncultured Streptococcus sp.]